MLKKLLQRNNYVEILSRTIKTTISDIGKINLTLQEKFFEKFNTLVDVR